MTNYFTPLDEQEHERGNLGHDVADRCLNCHQPFMDHDNGQCPDD